MTIINQAGDCSIADCHFQMKLCLPALIPISVSPQMSHVCQSLSRGVNIRRIKLLKPCSVMSHSSCSMTTLSTAYNYTRLLASYKKNLAQKCIFIIKKKKKRKSTDFYRSAHQSPGCIQCDSGKFWTCSCHSEGRYESIHLAFHRKPFHTRDS